MNWVPWNGDAMLKFTWGFKTTIKTVDYLRSKLGSELWKWLSNSLISKISKFPLNMLISKQKGKRFEVCSFQFFYQTWLNWQQIQLWKKSLKKLIEGVQSNKQTTSKQRKKGLHLQSEADVFGGYKQTEYVLPSLLQTRACIKFNCLLLF